MSGPLTRIEKVLLLILVSAVLAVGMSLMDWVWHPRRAAKAVPVRCYPEVENPATNTDADAVEWDKRELLDTNGKEAIDLTGRRLVDENGNEIDLAVWVTATTGMVNLSGTATNLWQVDAVNPLVFGPVSICTTNGDITIKQGVTLSEAAMAFWQEVAEVYPRAFPGK